MRSNYSREERQKIVEEYIQSGKSQTLFALEHEIKPNTLSVWIRKYKTTKKQSPFGLCNLKSGKVRIISVLLLRQLLPILP